MYILFLRSLFSPSGMSSEPEKPTLECYAQWLTRFKQVCEVCNSREFPKDEIIGYQLYLLDSGQFNANFVLEELLRLKYPLSPFIPTARHAYIRSSDTWAMELLSSDYCQVNKEAKIVWLVDSGQFWSEFQRYTHCIPISSLNTPDLVESVLTTPLWITCENNEQQLKAATKCKHDIIMAFAEKEKPVLASMFRTIIYGSNAPEMTDDMKQALRDMFPSVPESEHPFQSYSKEVKDWLKRKIESKVPVAFYYKEKILERHALVICEWTGELQSFNSVLDNLGYRMDPIKAIRLVLRKFPGLFVCVDDTEKFFEEYYNTTVYKSLTNDEQQLIKELVISIKETINNANGQLQLQLYTESGFTMIIERLLHYYQNVESLNELSIYFRFIEQCLKTISSNIEFSSSWFLNVAIPELTDVVESICTPSCQLAQVVRHTQRVSEVLLLYFETFQPEHLLSDIVTTEYLHHFPVQGVSLTPYAMRAFVRVFQLIDKYPNSSNPLCVSVTNQSYYEWLQDLERLDQHRISLFPVQYLDEAEPNSDVFFVEIHPNNVVATKQFAHDVIGLVGQLPERRSTLVIDITLNALNDSEVKGIISKALGLINSGHLNLILIQSLTKFSQLGLDKRSAGLIVMLNNNDEYWKGANEELKTLEQAEPVDVTTLQFFSYFHQCADDLRKYIEMINENTRHVYHSVMKQLDEMEVLSRKPFRLTLSSDPGACYIALNISGLIGIVNENFTLQENWMEQFLKDLLKHFIHPLCRLLKLPLTERMSIGFPLSSVNVVFDSLRITIGLESKADLDHYTDVLAYVAFVLNRIRIGRLELYTDATYRKEYFEEKVNLFSALHHLHFTPYEVIYYINTSQYDDRKGVRHFVERKVWIQKGTVNICHLPKIRILYVTEKIILRVKEKTYDESHILVRVCGKEQALCDLTYPQKRMVLSCLTGIRSPKETTANDVYLNVEEIKIKQANLDSQHVKISVTAEQIKFESFQIVDNWDKIQIYGPFPPDNINFRLNNMTISALIGDNELNLPIYVKQGSMCFPLSEMPIEDREFLFAEGPYENNRTPIGNHMMVKKVKEEKIVIERDYICVSKPGFTVFQRFITDTTTYFEIDYWSIKDPLLARFMRLMTAVYIHKMDTNIGFGARDKRLSHFLMNIDLGRGKPLMTEATEVVYHRRDCLHKLLLHVEASMVENTYSFLQKLSNLRNCSRKSLETYIGNPGLITAAYELLKPPSVPASLPAALPPGTGSPS